VLASVAEINAGASYWQTCSITYQAAYGGPAVHGGTETGVWSDNGAVALNDYVPAHTATARRTTAVGAQLVFSYTGRALVLYWQHTSTCSWKYKVDGGAWIGPFTGGSAVGYYWLAALGTGGINTWETVSGTRTITIELVSGTLDVVGWYAM
jgi:hypothetical protein